MIGPLSYVGGKRALANQIIALFPKHQTYIEVFAGGAQVLFHKEPSPVEVINDLDTEIVNFFRVCQQHSEELTRYLRFMVVSRHWHEVLKATDPGALTDIQKAARYLYLLKNSFASLPRRLSYKCHVVQPPGFNPERIPQLIEETHKRLARVQIECLPYEKALKKYDRRDSLFYLDPPYFRRELYRFNLKDEDFAKMSGILANLRGKFVLSLNDVSEVRSIFKAFKIRSVDLHYTAQRIAGKRFREVIITNF